MAGKNETVDESLNTGKKWRSAFKALPILTSRCFVLSPEGFIILSQSSASVLPLTFNALNSVSFQRK
jgi:hypothetical protein